MSEIVSLREYRASGRAPVVLVIDDDFAVRQTLSASLEDRGIDAVMAHSGRQALATLRRTEPDLVLMDVALPEEVAREAMRQIRRARPTAPIMAMSSSGAIGSGDLFARMPKLGADGVIAKPFDEDRLFAAVVDLLPRVPDGEPLAVAS
jgi:CheY-like chemotaxis protein